MVTVGVFMNKDHIDIIYKVAFKLIKTSDLCRKVIGITPDEYLGVGYIALQKAVKNYRKEYGTEFSTYATAVVIDQIIKYARKNSTLIKIASAYRYQAWRVQNGKEQTQGNSRGINAAIRVLNGKVTCLSNTNSKSKITNETNWIEQEEVYHLIKKMDERTRKILMLRFGLGGYEPKTLQEIGEMINLSRERVRQIEKEGLQKLKNMI
jgi:RNA polymerase sigma factor (sigma-70 family)